MYYWSYYQILVYFLFTPHTLPRMNSFYQLVLLYIKRTRKRYYLILLFVLGLDTIKKTVIINYALFLNIEF